MIAVVHCDADVPSYSRLVQRTWSQWHPWCDCDAAQESVDHNLQRVLSRCGPSLV